MISAREPEDHPPPPKKPQTKQPEDQSDLA